MSGRLFQHGVNLLVCGIALVYLVMAWMMTPADDWAVVNHPWQPTLQHLHVLTVPLLVFAVGMLWQPHILAGLRTTRVSRLDSGRVMVLLFAPMVASGYLLQVSTDEVWRDGWAWAHVVTGGLWVVGSTLHFVGARARAREAARLRESTLPRGDQA